MTHPNRSKTNRQRKANPTPGEVLAARERAGHTVIEAAALVYSSGAAWRRWEEGADGRRMHPAIYELYLIKTGQA